MVSSWFFCLVLQQICRQLAEMKEQIRYNTKLLQDLSRRQRGADRQKLGRLPSDCQLPLTTYSEVLQLEQQLKSKELYGQFVSHTTPFCHNYY